MIMKGGLQPIDEGIVRRLISSQFPEYTGLPINPVIPGGWDNRTYRMGETMSVL